MMFEMIKLISGQNGGPFPTGHLRSNRLLQSAEKTGIRKLQIQASHNKKQNDHGIICDPC